MKLYDFEDKNLIVAIQPFDSHEWFLAIAPLLNENIFMNYSEREVFESPKIKRKIRDFLSGDATKEDVNDTTLMDMRRRIQLLLIGKCRAYDVIFRTITEEFNPLWNVDGIEKLTYTRTNTGTQTNEVDRTDRNTGTQTTADGTTQTSTDSTTTYDSPTWRDTNKNVTANSGNVTRTDNLTATGNEDAVRTDDLTETYTEVKERGGNIGTTKTTDLQRDTLDLFSTIDFLNLVTHDIANVITCRTY